MEPRVPDQPQPPRRSLSRRAIIALCAGLALVASLSIIVPLQLTPGTTPRLQTQRPTATGTATALPPTPTATPYPQPSWITSDAAHIDAGVMPVGVDSTGAMAAPEGPNDDPVWFTTFWWELGPKPGQVGNAVIAGHLDRKDGSPAVFWFLSSLKIGDSVYVRNGDGTTLHFVVNEIEIYLNPTGGPDNPVLQKIFGPASTANLNLITCTGDWTGTEYNKKLVVFTTLAP